MELTQLQYFRKAAETEHFTRAAQELHITQPTLSKTISRLEKELGVQLFDRDNGAVRLNLYGRTFLAEIELMFVHLEQGKCQVIDLIRANAEEINIGITNQESLSPYLQPYLVDHPEIHMHQIQCTADEMICLLEQRKIDFSISILPIQVPSVEWIPLLSEEMGLIVSCRHPLARRDTVALPELSKERFLMHNSNTDLRNIFLELCAQAGFYPDIYFEGDQPDLLGCLIEANYGISICSLTRYRYLQQHENPRSIKYLSFSDVHYARNTGIARLRNRILSNAAQGFYEYLLRAMRKDPDD